MSQLIRGCVLVALSCGLAGCDRPAPVNVHPVAGRLTVAGQPAAHAYLAFHPLAEGGAGTRLAVGTTEAGGTFRLTTFATGDGAAAGEYAVTVVWPNTSIPRDECADPVTHDWLSGRFANSTTTPLRATVRPGPNEILLKVALAGNWSLPRMRDRTGGD
jgi:hypothetical protein